MSCTKCTHLRPNTRLPHCFQIAHRLDSVMGCDKVVVLDRGRIVEIGNPRSLIADPGGSFAELHKAQYHP